MILNDFPIVLALNSTFRVRMKTAGKTDLFQSNSLKSQNLANGPFAASGHMVHAGGQAAHWDIQNKENSNLS